MADLVWRLLAPTVRVRVPQVITSYSSLPGGMADEKVRWHNRLLSERCNIRLMQVLQHLCERAVHSRDVSS